MFKPHSEHKPQFTPPIDLIEVILIAFVLLFWLALLLGFTAFYLRDPGNRSACDSHFLSLGHCSSFCPPRQFS
jgi:hypothetical protein